MDNTTKSQNMKASFYLHKARDGYCHVETGVGRKMWKISPNLKVLDLCASTSGYYDSMHNRIGLDVLRVFPAGSFVIMKY